MPSFLVFSLIFTISYSSCLGLMYLSIPGFTENGDDVNFFLRTMRETKDIELNAMVEIGGHDGKSFFCLMDDVVENIPMISIEDISFLSHADDDLVEFVASKVNESDFCGRKMIGNNFLMVESNVTDIRSNDILTLTKMKNVTFFGINNCKDNNCLLKELQLAVSVLNENGIILIDVWEDKENVLDDYIEKYSEYFVGLQRFSLGNGRYFLFKQENLVFWEDKIIEYCQNERLKCVLDFSSEEEEYRVVMI